MIESSNLDPVQQLVRELRRRVCDLEEQNDRLRCNLRWLRDELDVSENFTPPDRDRR